MAFGILIASSKLFFGNVQGFGAAPGLPVLPAGLRSPLVFLLSAIEHRLKEIPAAENLTRQSDHLGLPAHAKPFFHYLRQSHSFIIYGALASVKHEQCLVFSLSLTAVWDKLIRSIAVVPDA